MPQCIDLWNNLEHNMRNIVDFETFKRTIIENRARDELYNFGERKFNIIHAQLRLNCSNLKSHLVSLHVLDDPTCVCGHDTENAHHYFFTCPLYDIERTKLFTEIGAICDVTLETILFGNQDLPLENNLMIFSHVHEFIKRSNRF